MQHASTKLDAALMASVIMTSSEDVSKDGSVGHGLSFLILNKTFRQATTHKVWPADLLSMPVMKYVPVTLNFT